MSHRLIIISIKAILLASILVMRIPVSAQEQSLEDYLVRHRYRFNVNSDGSFSVSDSLGEILLKHMDGKSLFVYGEGWSHGLRMNNDVTRALTEFFGGHQLKDVFLESPRSWVIEDEYFLTHPTISAASFYPAEPVFYQKSFERKRQLYNKGHYHYLGIDFERPHSLFKTLTLLVNELSADAQVKFNALTPYLKDTAWLQLPPKKFVAYYKEQRDKFYRDSSRFKEVMGQAYTAFRYLMSDPAPSEYHDNRNALMASHILSQLPPYAAGDVYMLDCGTAHARPGKKDGLQKTTVNLLAQSDRLKNKIVVMNLYCDSCVSAGDNRALDFMKREVLLDFRDAANAPVIVFDLSEIPDRYRYIKDDYGELLVYVTKAE